MEPITMIAVATTTAVAIFVRQYIKIKNKDEEIESLIQSLTQYSSSYSFETCDKVIINECQNYLKSYLNGKTFAQILQGKSTEEKKRITENLVSELSKRMKVQINTLNIQPLNGGTLGSEVVTDDGQIVLYLNECLLEADPDKLVFVMLHELRHAIQDSSLRNDIWGFSDERKAQWLIGNQQYVRVNSQAQFRAYYYQILENDANAFAEAVLKNK